MFCMRCGAYATGKVRTQLHSVCKIELGESIPEGSIGRRNQLMNGRATGTGWKCWPDGDKKSCRKQVFPFPAAPSAGTNGSPLGDGTRPFVQHDGSDSD